MMLELADVKKSHITAFILALFFVGVGAHRFYLGQMKIGAAILVMSVLVVATLLSEPTWGLGTDILSTAGSLFWLFLLSEVVLSPYYTSRVNRRIKAELAEKYKVEN